MCNVNNIPMFQVMRNVAQRADKNRQQLFFYLKFIYMNNIVHKSVNVP